MSQFHHIVRAAAAIAGTEYVTVFGSNAILPWLHDFGIDDMKLFLDPEMISFELDLCVGGEEEEPLNTLIDGAMGEGSLFDQTFEVYAHPNPVKGLFCASSSWPGRARVESVPHSDAKVIVPHYLDLAVSKIIAGRPKDMEFAARVVGLFQPDLEEIEKLVAEFLKEKPGEKEKVSTLFSVFRSRIKV